MYATGAGSIAADGEGRNGLFTSHFLKNLNTPGLEVNELFRVTGADVSQASGRRQIPAIYNQFFGRAYLGQKPVETAIPQPVPLQPVPPEKGRDPAKSARLWSLGASLGTTFSDPWFVGTISGTLAPFRDSFFDLGIDLGLVSGRTNVDYYSLYPFAHYAFFVPYKDAGGWYAGAGAGYMMAAYQFQEEEFKENTFAFDFSTGIIIKDFFNISYTLRTDFQSANNKLAVGYIRRF